MCLKVEDAIFPPTRDSLGQSCMLFISLESSSVHEGCYCARHFSITSPITKDLPFPWSEVEVAQSCPTLCDPMDYTVYGILQARILEWVAFPFSRGSSQPRDGTQIPCIAGRFFTKWSYEGCISLAPLKITKTNDKEHLTVNIKNYYT